MTNRPDPPSSFSEQIKRQQPTQGRTVWEYPLVEENGKVRLDISGISSLYVDPARGLDQRFDPATFEVRRGSPYRVYQKLDKSMRITKHGLAAAPQIEDVPLLKESLDAKVGSEQLDATNAELAFKVDSRTPVNASTLEGSDLATVIASAVSQAMSDVHPLMGVVSLDNAPGTNVYEVTGAQSGAPVVVQYDNDATSKAIGFIGARVTNSDELTIEYTGTAVVNVYYCIARYSV